MKTALLEQHTATDKKIEKIELDTITTKGLQTRAGTDAAKVAEYAEIYKAGGSMPPIVVFSDGGDEFYLADGHHRLAAARKADLSEIEGLIKKGDRRDALWYATAANAQHGLPRTNEDKRRAVGLILADAEWRQLSDAQLAEHAQVSDRLIAKVRKELGAESNTRKGKDGKVRAKPAKKTAAAPAKKRSGYTSDNQDLDEIAHMCKDEIAEVNDGWKRLHDNWSKITELSRYGVSEQRARIFTAMAAFPATDDCYMRLDVLRVHSGCRDLDADLRQLIQGGLVSQFDDGAVAITEQLVNNISRIVWPDGDWGPAPLTVEQVVARLEAHMATTQSTASSYAAAHSLPKFGLQRLLETGVVDSAVYGEIYDYAVKLPAPAAPPAGPEDLTVDSIAQPPKASPEIPASKLLQQQGEDLFQKTDPAPKAEKPAPPQTKGDLILIAERSLISVELLKGKPQWTGTDTDLLALALIVGVPTRKLAWIDSVRANATHLFIEALRSEVADRVRNGEHTNRGWPVTPELCRLWGLDYQALHLRAQHQVEK